jgi:hypothetical protein
LSLTVTGTLQADNGSGGAVAELEGRAWGRASNGTFCGFLAGGSVTEVVPPGPITPAGAPAGVTLGSVESSSSSAVVIVA